MANVTNPLAGASADASAEVIYQGRLCVPSGAALFTPDLLPAGGRANLAVDNLASLTWYLFLERSYQPPAGGPPFISQNDISWVPTVQINRASGISNIMSLPFAAPAILPINIPVRLEARAAVQDIGFTLNVPRQPSQTINSIHFLLTAAQ